MVTAGKNCGNGAINYAEQLGELTNIMRTFGGEKHIGKNPNEQELNAAKVRLVDAPIKAAIGAAINRERLTEDVNHANDDPNDPPKSNMLRALSRMRNQDQGNPQNNFFNAADLNEFNDTLTANRQTIAETDETRLQRINRAITRAFYNNMWNTDSKYHQDCQRMLQTEM